MRVEVTLAGVRRLSRLETRLSHTAFTLVSEGAGIAIINAASACEFVERGVVVRPFGVPVDASFLAIRSANQPARASWAGVHVSSGTFTTMRSTARDCELI